MKKPKGKPDPLSQPFMGVSEIASYRGVSKQVICNWANREKLPEPHCTLKIGRIWKTEDVVRHFERTVDKPYVSRGTRNG